MALYTIGPAGAPVMEPTSEAKLTSFTMLAAQQKLAVGGAGTSTESALIPPGTVEERYVQDAARRADAAADAPAAAGGAGGDPMAYAGLEQAQTIAAMEDSTGGNLVDNANGGDPFLGASVRGSTCWWCWLALAAGLGGGALAGRYLRRR